MLTLSLLAMRVTQAPAARAALVRVSRAAMMVTAVGVLPLASAMMQAGVGPGGMQQALADHAFAQMGSTILR